MTQPSLAEAVAHHAAGRLADAVRLYQAILARAPGDPDAMAGLGVAALDGGRPEMARPLLAEAARRKPDDALIHNNLANAAKALGDPAEARTAYRRAVALMPGRAELIANLAGGLDGNEARPWAERAVRLAPDDADGWFVLAASAADAGRLSTALTALARSLALAPARAGAWFNRANALRDLGEVLPAVAHYRRAVALDPADDGAASNLIFALSFVADDAAVIAANRAWGRRVEAVMPSAAPFANDRSEDRPLVVGYLSPDFRRHQFVKFLEPLLRNHDRSRFRPIAYADVARPDSETERLKTMFETWRDVAGIGNDALDRQIRDDKVDILVCVTGYLATDRRRFVPKRAPVQVAAINHVSTTGLDAFDARITDRWLDPPELGDAGPESLIRLAAGYAVFDPPASAPALSPPPAGAEGDITFGSFNNLAKLTDESLVLFRRVLEAVPRSRLLIKAMALSDDEPRTRFVARLTGAGLDLGRVELVGRIATDPANLAAIARADIALDPVPFNGGMSTADALWMGVPVVSLRGPSLVGRVGASMLSRAGLADLVADSAADYIRIAAGLATDRPRLAALRNGMRVRVGHSSLSNGRIFASEMERAYRTLWHRWCRR
jgi:protein O-GlcNAc transferase